MSGARARFTPPASASSHSPARRLAHASWTETSEEDCPVSTSRLGPRTPRWCEIRLAITPRCSPVMAWWDRPADPCREASSA
ncbi:hypothetical protein AN220_08970 [Streptomyces nanshensis]|nr:hypothetical protein AN220_08970 [Streptomyces nanshensis]